MIIIAHYNVHVNIDNNGQIEDYCMEMTFLSRNHGNAHLKAKQYRLENVRGMAWIVPDSNEVEEIRLTPQDKLDMSVAWIDMLIQIIDITKPFLPLLDNDGEKYRLKRREISERIMYRNCGELLLEFCNRYGLFNILNDRIIPWLPKAHHGYYGEAACLEQVFVPTNKGEQEIARYLDREEILPTGAMPYSQAAWYFFPYKKTKHYPSMYFPLEEEDFYLNYGESVHDILYNSRVFGMILHLNKMLVFDGLNRSDEVEPYRVYGTDIVFENRNGDWDITAGYKTLVQLLDTLYATSQMAYNKHVQVCQHVTCRKVFLAEAKSSKYCSKACAENALKWRYRQKKKREGK